MSTVCAGCFQTYVALPPSMAVKITLPRCTRRTHNERRSRVYTGLYAVASKHVWTSKTGCRKGLWSLKPRANNWCAALLCTRVPLHGSSRRHTHREGALLLVIVLPPQRWRLAGIAPPSVWQRATQECHSLAFSPPHLAALPLVRTQ